MLEPLLHLNKHLQVIHRSKTGMTKSAVCNKSLDLASTLLTQGEASLYAIEALKGLKGVAQLYNRLTSVGHYGTEGGRTRELALSLLY